MYAVFLMLMVLTVGCDSYTKPKTFPGRNQRIIKVQGPPYYNHFHGHHKPIRSRPYGLHHGDEFIRPNHPPPIPPFFNGPSNNHVKHLPRSPPHVFHKAPSYGLGFPYKTFGSVRPSAFKGHFRIQNVGSVRPASSSRPTVQIASISSSSSSSSSTGSSIAGSGTKSQATSTSFHSPAFATSSYLPPVGHIINSDDNNGPIREIPAPNLALKPHGDSFGSVGGVGAGNIGSIESIENIGGIGSLGNIGSVSSVSHIQTDEFLSSFGSSEPAPLDINVDVDAIVKDTGHESTYVKQTSGDLVFGKEPTVEIANFEEGSSLDVTNLVKNAAEASEHSSGYEVTEHNHLPTNDQIIKGYDGSKLYYAPDPDPSLPVHKVPPTTDPHSTPSNSQIKNINNAYLPPATSYSYFQGNGIGTPVASLTTHELFQLMNGYPTVLSQPIVTFVNQPQTPGLTLPGAAHSYIPQNSVSNAGHYSPTNDIAQYLSQPEIHDLIHNSHDSHPDPNTLGSSQSSVVSRPQQTSTTQSQYQNYAQTQYTYKNLDSNSDSSLSEVEHNYQYEPEASESDNTGSLTVIRQIKDTHNSETVKDLLLEDSASNELFEKTVTPSSPTTILQLKNIPEVPFYASLPNKKAAEALASLQAAGSVANNYMDQIKISRGDQESGRERKIENHQGDTTQEEVRKLGIEKTVLDIQQSVPVYETSLSSQNLVDAKDEILEEEAEESQVEEDLANIDFKENDSNQTFGKRIRPK